MAHKKGAGSTDNGRDSKPKYLGVKMFGGQVARAGNIIIRQRGTKFHAGDNTYLGKDHTIHAYVDGIVTFKKGRNDKSTVYIMPFTYGDDGVAIRPEAKKVVAPVAKAAKTTAPKAPVAAKPTVAKAAAPKVEVKKTAPVVVEAPAVVETVVVEAPVVIEPAVLHVAPTVEAPVIEIVETVEVVAEEAPKTAAPVARKGGPKQDDLKIVEGIGPKIELLLHEGGIKTWAELAVAPIARLKEILDAAGPRYQMHDPATWPAQSKFANEGNFEELKEYQDMLTGGRDKSE